MQQQNDFQRTELSKHRQTYQWQTFYSREILEEALGMINCRMQIWVWVLPLSVQVLPT